MSAIWMALPVLSRTGGDKQATRDVISAPQGEDQGQTFIISLYSGGEMLYVRQYIVYFCMLPSEKTDMCTWLFDVFEPSVLLRNALHLCVQSDVPLSSTM